MLASWFSAWSCTQSSKALDLPLRQATGQGTAPSIRHLCYSTPLTSTDASCLRCISALWTSNLHMTGRSGSCYGISFAVWGVQGTMLGAIQSLYDGCLLSMRVDGVTGESQALSMGLRQGCPLSATLFGLFIDGLHHYSEAAVPTAGIQILQMRL